MFSASNPRAASAYQRINVETSMHTIDQHQLVSLLYAGVLNSIATARGAMARGDVAGKCNGISRAVRILEEGLRTARSSRSTGKPAARWPATWTLSTTTRCAGSSWPMHATMTPCWPKWPS